VTIIADRLLYVAEVVAMYGAHDLILIWGAEPEDPEVEFSDETLVTLDSPVAQSIMPPIIGQIRVDMRDGWSPQPRWLGNVRQPPQAVDGVDPN
jgi:hypothetical protein